MRVGVLLEGEEVPRHYVVVLEDLLASNFVDLALVVLATSSEASANTGDAQPAHRIELRRWSRVLFDAYTVWDAARERQDDPFEPVRCTHILSGLERLEVVLDVMNSVPHVPPEAVEVIRQKDLDVLLNLRSGGLSGTILDCTRHGVWSFVWGDPEQYRGGPPHVWESLERNPLTVTGLEVMANDPERRLLLCRTVARTGDTPSISQNRRDAVWETTHFAIWKLHDVHRFGWDHVRKAAQFVASPGERRPRYDVPSNMQMARWLLGATARSAWNRVHTARRYKTWDIGLRFGGIPLCDAATSASLKEFRWVRPPPAHFWADPFIVARHGRHFLFVEDYSYAERRGIIRCAEVLQSGDLAEMVTCLDTGSHLSYPMVFANEDQMYMVPESAAATEVALYHATEFPYRWTKEAVLLEGVRACDTTVLHLDGTWWFFVTFVARTAALKLLLFYSDTLTGRWKYHPANPISSDVRNCRGAGAIFHHADRLIRPSQSCAEDYGYSITFHEILELTRSGYRERPLRTIEPTRSSGIIKTHTYGRCDDIEVIDGGVWAPIRRRTGRD